MNCNQHATSNKLPERIRARVFEGALSRVTRMYAAGLADVFTETLQNSRRAGATRVRVTIDASEDTPGVLSVTLADDGAGIADPAVLLSFGENGWSEDLVRREDAAGMGFLSLARRGCTVASRPRAGDGDMAPGWRVDLTPAHFLGEEEATVVLGADAPRPHGTAVRFRTDEAREAIRRTLENAARHYPLPVTLDGEPFPAGPSSRTPSMPNPGGASPSASSRGEAATGTSPISTSTA